MPINAPRIIRISLLSFLIGCSCLMSIDRLRAQSSAPPPLGHLVNIGGRQLHLFCLGSGSPTVIIENGNSAVSVDRGLVRPHRSKITRGFTYCPAGYALREKGAP